MTLPEKELERLEMTTRDAGNIAAAGEIANGYAMLMAGLRRAKEIRDGGAEYGADLAKRWQDALDRFAERWRIGRA